MIALVSILLFIVLAVEISTTILTYTGMDRDKARFQALSALTSTGFTSKESEIIMRHPVRRRIIMFLMGMSYIGIASIFSSLISIYIDTVNWLYAFLIIGIAVGIYFIITHPKIANWISKLVYRGIERRVEGFEQFEEMLRLGEDYIIREISIQRMPDLIGRTLREERLKDRHILVLAIRNQFAILNMPPPDYVFSEGDRLVIYGPKQVLAKLIKANRP